LSFFEIKPESIYNSSPTTIFLRAQAKPTHQRYAKGVTDASVKPSSIEKVLKRSKRIEMSNSTDTQIVGSKKIAPLLRIREPKSAATLQTQILSN